MANLSQGAGSKVSFSFLPLRSNSNREPTEHNREKESNFYKGGQPQWLNFQNAASPLVKRDGYEDVIKKIREEKRSHSTVTSVKLFHQPGSGGSTLAMQVLWDLREEFACAVVEDGTDSPRSIFQQVIALFRGGKHKTVLILMDNVPSMNALQNSLIQQIANASIKAKVPVVVILKCVRAETFQEDSCVHLKTELSEEEKKQFKEKQTEISNMYGISQCSNFHGFNIMQHNFSAEYVNRVTRSVSDLKGKEFEKKETTLLSCLALLNSYIPGSSLKKTDCLRYLSLPEPTGAKSALEVEMQPFSHLLVTISGEGEDRAKDSVRMCHPLIAKRCIELFESVGWKKSCITEKLLTYADEVQTRDNAVQTILTKRKKRGSEQENFSRLILDIQNEGNDKCTKILKQASDTFKYNPFLPQALARFYYIEKPNFEMAEKFAQEAMDRKPDNSFIADTLGRVHKTHMKKTFNPSEISHLAKKAIEAFQKEDRLAEIEASQADENMYNIFNHRGKYGCVQVANIVTDKCSELQSSDLPESLKGEVEKKCAFFETYLTYSKSSIQEDDPTELHYHVTKFIQNYAKQNSGPCTEEGAASFPRILHCLDKKPDLNEINFLRKKISEWRKTSTNTQNYILVNIALSCKEPTFQLLHSLPEIKKRLLNLWDGTVKKTPELYLLVLLLFWPESEDGYTAQEKDHRGTNEDTDEEVSLVQTSVQQMKESYEQTYSKYLRSRYLVPLFFLGKGDGLSRLVHRSKIDDCLVQSASFDLNQQWSSGEVWNNSTVNGLLRRVNGVARERKVYVSCAGKQIEVHPHKLASVRHRGDLSFYLGFNIKGPVAYDIKYN